MARPGVVRCGGICQLFRLPGLRLPGFMARFGHTWITSFLRARDGPVPTEHQLAQHRKQLARSSFAVLVPGRVRTRFPARNICRPNLRRPHNTVGRDDVRLCPAGPGLHAVTSRGAAGPQPEDGPPHRSRPRRDRRSSLLLWHNHVLLRLVQEALARLVVDALPGWGSRFRHGHRGSPCRGVQRPISPGPCPARRPGVLFRAGARACAARTSEGAAMSNPPTSEPVRLPALRELGADLLVVGIGQKLLTLALPFLWCGAYFVFALAGYWPLAVFALMALSFVTYGSISHDLVHRNLGLSRTMNDILLCLVELLALRSGHAYQAAHLHHHARFPHPDDVEARAAGKSWMAALAEGFVCQFRVYLWALQNAKQGRRWVIGEGIACALLLTVAVVLSAHTAVFVVYAALMVMGTWVIPLVTSYLPHDPRGENELSQTRAFRGVMCSVPALEHLYHLEHHLYPAVPHHNWPKLARRLDPHLARAGVKPVKLWF